MRMLFCTRRNRFWFHNQMAIFLVLAAGPVALQLSHTIWYVLLHMIRCMLSLLSVDCCSLPQKGHGSRRIVAVSDFSGEFDCLL